MTKFFIFLYAFCCGLNVVYLEAGIEPLAISYGIHGPLVGSLASLFWGVSFISVMVLGPLVADYLGTLWFCSVLCLCIGTIITVVVPDLIASVLTELVLGIGLSIWLPLGFVRLRYETNPDKFPLFSGAYLTTYYLGMACLPMLKQLSKVDLTRTLWLYAIINFSLLMVFSASFKKIKVENKGRMNKRVIVDFLE